MLVLVMGVAGSGKTTVGRALAAALGAVFLDADDFHPPANIEKMSRGQPLTDDDRRPWLEAMNRALRARRDAGESIVLACSALKASYRERLSRGLSDAMHIVYLRVDRATLRRRMTTRAHFMPVALLDSQLDALEEPSDAIVVDGDVPVATIVTGLVHRLTVE